MYPVSQAIHITIRAASREADHDHIDSNTCLHVQSRTSLVKMKHSGSFQATFLCYLFMHVRTKPFQICKQRTFDETLQQGRTLEPERYPCWQLKRQLNFQHRTRNRR